MDVPFSIEVKQAENTVDMIITGDLIINHITKIKEQIENSIDYSKNLGIRVTNPSSIDITFIQILFSLKNKYENKEVDFKFEGILNEELHGLVSNAGFQDLFKL
ncbi:STAS domain-containing protein [Labilibacter sediminis]|nr:STAS domain-containing protein [Labilibacter sediminis]